MRQLFFIALVLTAFVGANAQEITANVSGDAKLTFFGDSHGNPPLTPNFQIGTEWRGNVSKSLIQFFVRPDLEYAHLSGVDYRRYSANIGWRYYAGQSLNLGTFRLAANGNDFFVFDLSKLTTTASIGHGFIDFDGARFSAGANFQLGYQITRTVEVFIDWQIVERRDLLKYPSTKKILGTAWRGSGLFGFKVTLKDTRSSTIFNN